MNRLSVWYAECSQRPFGSTTIRTLPPCLNVSTVRMGVAKSCTSSRRSRFLGSDVLMKSTISTLPCCLMSIPVAASDRSTTIRPSPAVPRRKSTSRSVCSTSLGRDSANRCTTCAFASSWSLWSNSVTRTALPSTEVSNVCGRLRLNTTRVRLPAWITLRLRSATSSMTRCVTPSPLPVSRKSRAIRGGVAIAKPAGGLAGAFFNVNFTMVRPETPFRYRQRIDAVGGLREGRARLGQREHGEEQRARAAGPSRPGHDGVKPDERAHFLRSCVLVSAWINCRVPVRSVQSPPPSCTSSFKRISLSVMPRTTPKFCPR